MQAMQILASKSQNNARTTDLAYNDDIPRELSKALQQVLISTKTVPFTDGYLRNLRHEGHNQTIMHGSLTLFSTWNFADTYSPLQFLLLQGDCAAQPVAHRTFNVLDEDPDMPTLKEMHRLVARSPRAQVKFFLLMDDIVDLHFLGFQGTHVGTHVLEPLSPLRLTEDNTPSTCIPGTAGLGESENEPFESQQRGFQHGHRKCTTIPKRKESDVVRMLRETDSKQLKEIIADFKRALIACAETLQYEASTLPAQQMGQSVLPEKFTLRQQMQSKLDGGLEIDEVTQRPLLPVTELDEPQGHIVLEQRRANAERVQARNSYSQVSLRGCHQSTNPWYRIQSFISHSCTACSVDEVGMISARSSSSELELHNRWHKDEHGHYQFSHTTDVPTNINHVVTDAQWWMLSFARDVRALHQLNHDHDCTSTCVKYIKNQSKDKLTKAIQAGKAVACRFFFFFIVVLTVVRNGVSTVKKIRRRGKQLVSQAYIARTNQRNEFGRVMVRRDRPFRSASNDVAQPLGRCNIDFQFMPRALDDEALEIDSAEQPGVCEVDPQLALAMYAVRFRMPAEPLLRRVFHSMVAMFQAAHNCDYYITKYSMCGRKDQKLLLP